MAWIGSKELIGIVTGTLVLNFTIHHSISCSHYMCVVFSTLLVKLSFARKRLIISSERDVVIDEVPAHGAYQPTLCTQGRYEDRSNSLADYARVPRCSKAYQFRACT